MATKAKTFVDFTATLADGSTRVFKILKPDTKPAKFGPDKLDNGRHMCAFDGCSEEAYYRRNGLLGFDVGSGFCYSHSKVAAALKGEVIANSKAASAEKRTKWATVYSKATEAAISVLASMKGATGQSARASVTTPYGESWSNYLRNNGVDGVKTLTGEVADPAYKGTTLDLPIGKAPKTAMVKAVEVFVEKLKEEGVKDIRARVITGRKK